jgi:cobalt-zinc-cadmium resistance protein CzcA
MHRFWKGQFAKKYVVVGITVFAVFVFSVSCSKMGGEFIPTLAEGDFAFHCILPQGTSLSQSIETSMQASRIIMEFDEVKMVVGKTGAAEVPTDPMPPEATDMMIILKQQSDEWKRDVSYDELADEIMEAMEHNPWRVLRKEPTHPNAFQRTDDRHTSGCGSQDLR